MQTWTLSATTNHDLGDAAPDAVSRWVVELEESGGNWSTVVQGRVAGGGGTFQAIAYTDMADGTVKTAALTGANELILIDASGLEVRLVATRTGGSLIIRAIPLLG